MDKKAQGISMEIIVIAVIVLLVLVVISVVFVGRLGIFSKSVGECENKGGKCVLSSEICPTDFPQAYSDWSCPDTANKEAQKCCIKVIT
jgi:hypothetical protein